MATIKGEVKENTANITLENFTREDVLIFYDALKDGLKGKCNFEGQNVAEELKDLVDKFLCEMD